MQGISPELAAQIEAERKKRADHVSKIWRDGLSHKDWLFDGRPIRGPVMLERFNLLQWDKAWLDLEPSVAGNLGPYWHVPLHWDDDDTSPSTVSEAAANEMGYATASRLLSGT